MQIETTMRYHFILTKMTKIKKNDDPRCWWDVEQSKLSHITYESNDTTTLHNHLSVSYKLSYVLTIMT